MKSNLNINMLSIFNTRIFIKQPHNWDLKNPYIGYSNRTISGTICHNIKYKPVIFKLKKKEDKNFIYASIHNDFDYITNFKLVEIYLSKIYLHYINNIAKQLFGLYDEKVHNVIFDIICSYLDIGNIFEYEKIYKGLVNQLLVKN